MLESNAPLSFYLGFIRRWLDQHPSEIIVIWVSNHGNAGAGYPGADWGASGKLGEILVNTFGDLLMGR